MNLRFVDTLENKVYTCKDIECKFKSKDGDTFTLSFKTDISILKGDLYIDYAPSFVVMFDDDSVWTKYPIKVPDISFVSKKGATGAAGTAMTTINGGRMAIGVAITFAGPAAANYLDNLMNTLYILKMLEGPMVSYPEAILDYSMDTTLIPISMDNPFEKWVKQGMECTPSEQLYRRGLDCNIFLNQGINLIQIVLILTACVAIGYLAKLVLRKLVAKFMTQEHELVKATVSTEKKEMKTSQNYMERKRLMIAAKKSRLIRIILTVGSLFGVQFFFIKLEGSQLEMVLTSMVNLKNSSRYSADAVGSLVGIAILLYYFVMGLLCFIQSIWVWERILRLRERRGNRNYKGQIGEHIALHQSPFPLLNFNFDELKVPDHYWQLLNPVVINLRNFGLCTVVTFIIGKPWQQVTLAMLVESLTLLFECLANAKANRSEFWSLVLMRAFTLLYLAFKNMSTKISMSDDTRQYKIGVAMAIFLVLIMAIGICFALYTIGLMIVNLVKSIIKKIKTYKELKKLTKEEQESQHLNASAQSTIALNIGGHSISPDSKEVQNSEKVSVKISNMGRNLKQKKRKLNEISQNSKEIGTPTESKKNLNLSNKAELISDSTSPRGIIKFSSKNNAIPSSLKETEKIFSPLQMEKLDAQSQSPTQQRTLKPKKKTIQEPKKSDLPQPVPNNLEPPVSEAKEAEQRKPALRFNAHIMGRYQ
jgi:hypothetical protein